MQKFISRSAAAVALAGLVFLSFAPAASATDTKVKICHITSSASNPWNAIEVSVSAQATHLGHGDFLYTGSGLSDSWCESHAPAPVSAANPTLTHSCGLDIALVLDTSSSINSSELSTMKTAFTNFVTALAPTPSMFSVTQFYGTGSVVHAFTANTTDTNNAINGLTSTGHSGTNFEDGLLKAFGTFDPRADKPDLVVFASDGNPNRLGTAGASASEVVAENAAITQANLLKADGIRVITLGIGSDLDNANLIKLSSADANYSAAAFSDVGTELAALANELCGGTITVQKMVDTDGNPETAPVAASEGWNFTIGGQSKDTDNFGKTPAVELLNGSYSVTETVPQGYSLQSASCTNQNEGTEGSYDDGGVYGIALGTNDIISCTFVNVPTTGTIHVVKHVVGSEVSPSNFAFALDGGESINFEEDGQNDVVVSVGTHSVTEKLDDAYTTTYSGCSEINVTPNGDATCTITNTYIPQQCLNTNVEHSIVSNSDTTHDGNPTVAVNIPGYEDNGGIHPAWTASIPGATWIWSTNPPVDTVDNLTETFVRTFSITGTPVGDATLDIAADNSYAVDVNGNTDVCVDTTENNFGTADTCNIPNALLSTGVNTLTFHVKNWALEGGTAQTNPAGLLFKLTYHGNECVEEAQCVADLNLAKNGSFEAPVVADNGGTWQLFGNGTPLLEWMSRYLSLNTPPLLEIQRGYSGWLAADGMQFAELDSNEPTSIYQDIPTIPGKTYKVSYAFAARPDASTLADNTMSVWWGGTSVATPSSNTVSAGPNTDWKYFTHSVLATTTTTRVEFADAGTANSLGNFVDKVSVSCVPDQEEPTTATIVATKVVCDSEADLPNWGAGGDDITSTTATDYVAAHPEACHLEPWTFEWAPSVATNPGDNVAVGGSPWTPFTTSVSVPAGSLVWVREQFNDDYVPFTYGTGENQSDADNESAELYCSTDVLHYDNYDWVSPVEAGETYYCVGFNAPLPSEHVTDMCPNIPLDQAIVPDGMHVDNEGDCVPNSTIEVDDGDLCSNMEGVQTNIPNGFHQEDGMCIVNQSGGGGGGGGNGPIFGSGVGGGGLIAPGGQVLGASCGVYMDRFIRFGKKNNAEQVKKLQAFLNKWEKSGLPETGFYGPLTLAAVNAFQAHYSDEILKPWQINAPTGIVYLATLRWINMLECPDLALQIPELIEWSKNHNIQD